MNLPIGYELLEYQNTRDDLIAYRERGALRGVFLGFPLLHENYTMSTPGTTDWTGYPGSGKTEFLLELLLNTSLFYGWKHLLYVPDVGDKNEVLSNLIHKLTGKTFDKRFENYIDEDAIDKNLQWILEHFFILYEKDEFSKITPFQFWDFAAYLSVNKGLHTATIDSWKDLEINVMPDGTLVGRDDKYLEKVLKYRNKIADKYKLSLHTIIHPTNVSPDKDGKRPIPKPFNLSGGAQWFNSGRTMITVHRIDGTANEVDVIITKAKPKSVAKLGTVRMFFDVKKARFYFVNEFGEKTYANHVYEKPKALALNDSSMFANQEEEDDLPF
jgi:twinkle protein